MTFVLEGADLGIIYLSVNRHGFSLESATVGNFVLLVILLMLPCYLHF
jgi:hypothetical protein